jgi:Cu-Zn family superoxide dismutase
LLERDAMKIILPVLVGLCLTAGCSAVVPGTRATAELKDGDGRVVGLATLRERSDGVLVRIEASGLKPGLHAVHVHAVGKCEGPSFSSAGGHFNPLGRKHGHKNVEGPHAGDVPNMLVAKDGSARFEVLTDGFTLRPGPLSLFDADGSALVIHVGVDDYVTDPTGNAGDRAACGVIAAR